MLELLSPSVSAQQTALIALSPSLSIPEMFSESNAEIFFDCFRKLVQQKLHTWLILDFSQTRTIDSAGLDCLARVVKLARKQNLQLLGLNVESHVELALRLDKWCSSLEISCQRQPTKFDSLAYWQEIVAAFRES
ncbi:MAG: STAS domain-containing protein [Cyanobacteria bacterium J06597_1]